MSFINERVQPEGLTFDDVLLIPAYSEVLPREVNVQTRFSRNISLNIPIVSAAMDTVTEAPLAIALAREGGIGVIHKNMTIAEQAAQVRKVKRAENGMIYDPVTISKDHTVGDALNLMKENKIGGIPVVDADRMLIGIVTNRDLRFETDDSRPIGEVMTSKNLITAPVGTTLEQAQEVVVDSGVCRGLTIAEVAKKRPVNLRFYLTPGNKSKDNIVRAAAQLVLNSLQKAG